MPSQFRARTVARTRSQSIPVAREALRFTKMKVIPLLVVVLRSLKLVLPIVVVAMVPVIVLPLVPTMVVLVLILFSRGLVMVISLNPLPHLLTTLTTLLHLVLRTRRAGRMIRPPMLPVIVWLRVRRTPLTPLLLWVRIRPTTTRVAKVWWID